MQGHDMKTNQFWYQSMQRYKIQSGLWLNKVPAKANDIPFWRWWDWITVAPLCGAAHLTVSQIINTATICNEVTSLTLHCIFVFPFYLIHIVWPSSSLHAFFPPSHEQAAHQRHMQQILCEIEQLCSTQQLLWVQLPGHTVWLVHVCECQCDELNGDDAAAGDHPHTSGNLGALSILYPLFITFSSFPFNLCRQGRHQSEWQVVWSSFRAWWEKERCQHKYPSWIRGGHGAATATMNRHPLSQADKTGAHQHGWKPSHHSQTPPSPLLLPSTNNIINTVTLLLVLDCLPIFISTQADYAHSLLCYPADFLYIYTIKLALLISWGGVLPLFL